MSFALRDKRFRVRPAEIALTIIALVFAILAIRNTAQILGRDFLCSDSGSLRNFAENSAIDELSEMQNRKISLTSSDSCTSSDLVATAQIKVTPGFSESDFHHVLDAVISKTGWKMAPFAGVSQSQFDLYQKKYACFKSADSGEYVISIANEAESKSLIFTFANADDASKVTPCHV